MTKTYECKSELSERRRQLLELLQRINFGQIFDLHVYDGEPAFDPPPRVLYEIKFPSGGPPPKRSASNFELKAAVIEFFQQLDRIGTGIVRAVEVRYGLPVRLTVEEVLGKEAQ